MPDVTNFLPSTRGFSFPNYWPPLPHRVIPTPLGNITIGAASNGLCGGMVFAVRDYFEANILPPSGQQPTLGDPLYDFIVGRLYDSFDLPNGPIKYYDWMTTADHNTWLKTGLSHRTILEEWPKIKDDLDHDRLSCLGLVTIFSLNPGDMGDNHQVLAYGYDLSADNILILRVYDPNSPGDDDIRLSLSLNSPSRATPINHNVSFSHPHPVRGFFHIPYHWVSPPQIDDAEIVTFLAPMAMPAGGNTVVTLQVRNTGTTTWTPGGATPYRLGSQRPQDNTTWGISRMELPHTVNPREEVVFTFAVTAPISGGQALMGWRMVKELVHWFGELEERSVNVIGVQQPVHPCDQLRDEILAIMQEIRDLQAELHNAVGQGKAFIVSQIRKRQTELTKLRNEAKAQGCPNIP